MLRKLAVIRRFLLCGTLAIIALVFYYDKSVNTIISLVSNTNIYIKAFSIYFLFAPLLFLIMSVVSVKYIRKNGLSSAYNSERLFIIVLLEEILYDLTSPFRTIVNAISLKMGKVSEYVYDDTIDGSVQIYKKRITTGVVCIIFHILVLQFLLIAL